MRSITSALLLLAAAAAGQGLAHQQTLPRAWVNGISFPQQFSGSIAEAVASSQQLHYDATQFTVSRPLVITDVAMQLLSAPPGSGPWSFATLELVMTSSPRDYTVAGQSGVPGHAYLFASNLGSDQELVRPARPWTSTASPSNWVSLGPIAPFIYDPRTGRDFLLQIRACGPAATQGRSILGGARVQGYSGVLGGNLYGGQPLIPIGCAATGANPHFVQETSLPVPPTTSVPGLTPLGAN